MGRETIMRRMVRCTMTDDGWPPLALEGIDPMQHVLYQMAQLIYEYGDPQAPLADRYILAKRCTMLLYCVLTPTELLEYNAHYESCIGLIKLDAEARSPESSAAAFEKTPVQRAKSAKIRPPVHEAPRVFRDPVSRGGEAGSADEGHVTFGPLPSEVVAEQQALLDAAWTLRHVDVTDVALRAHVLNPSLAKVAFGSPVSELPIVEPRPASPLDDKYLVTGPPSDDESSDEDDHALDQMKRKAQQSAEVEHKIVGTFLDDRYFVAGPPSDDEEDESAAEEAKYDAPKSVDDALGTSLAQTLSTDSAVVPTKTGPTHVDRDLWDVSFQLSQKQLGTRHIGDGDALQAGTYTVSNVIGSSDDRAPGGSWLRWTQARTPRKTTRCMIDGCPGGAQVGGHVIIKAARIGDREYGVKGTWSEKHYYIIPLCLRCNATGKFLDEDWRKTRNICTPVLRTWHHSVPHDGNRPGDVGPGRRKHLKTKMAHAAEHAATKAEKKKPLSKTGCERGRK